MRDAATFLRRAGFDGAARDRLPVDASHRSYTRLHDGPRPALLMDAPPPEDVRPFLSVARHIAGLGCADHGPSHRRDLHGVVVAGGDGRCPG